MILFLHLINQQVLSQVPEEKICFDIDSKDSKLECYIADNFYNTIESNTTAITDTPNRYSITIDNANLKKILTILKLKKNDDGNGTFYSKARNNSINNIYNTLIYSKI